MGRKYIRKTSKPHAEPRVILDAVQRTLKGESLRLVAEDCGLSKTALQRFVAKHKGKEIGESLLGPNYQHAMIFTPQQEAELALYVAKCSNMFYGLTAETTRSLAYQMAVANEIKCPPSWENNKKAGIGWLRGFMERNYEVEYLRKKHVKDSARGTIFVKASTEDISSVPAKQIRALLPPPSMSGTTKRTQSNIVFGVNFGNLQLR